jgi:hypothetical protein
LANLHAKSAVSIEATWPAQASDILDSRLGIELLKNHYC